MDRKKRFITSALPYVNNQPHLGNVIGSVLSADVYARFSRKMGYDTIFVSGTDEYGTATEMEAMKQEVHPRDIVNTNRELHRTVYEWFNIKFDCFGHTDSRDHIELTQEIFLECWNNGYFTEEETEQFFCNHCSQFLADRYVEGTCHLCKYDGARGDQCDSCGKCFRSTDLLNPKCALCKNTPVLKDDKHLMLRLDLLAPDVRSYFDSRYERWSQNAQNIFKGWMANEIRPRSMTRSLKYMWGVPVPLPDYGGKVLYVWFDAPIGYFTFLKRCKSDWKKWVEDAETVQFMGKDNVTFHSLIFPAIIIGASKKVSDGYSESKIKYPMVSRICSTEYLMFNGEKFSKSRGVGIFGMDLVKQDLGCSDFWRFFLIKVRPESKDSDFAIRKFIEHVSGDLVSNWGNFCNRTLKYIAKQLGGEVNVVGVEDGEADFVKSVNLLFEEYKELMERAALREALDKTLEISSYGNKFLQELQGKGRKSLNRGFSVCYSLVVLLSHLFEPFTPDSSQAALKMCACTDPYFPKNFSIIEHAAISSEIAILFPRWTEQQLENLNAKVRIIN